MLVLVLAMAASLSGATLPGAAALADVGVANVFEFGAKGDGVADDTIAIRKAIASVSGKALPFVAGFGHYHGTVYFPPAVYAISGNPAIVITQSISLDFAKGATLWYNKNNGTAVQIGNETHLADKVSLSGLIVQRVATSPFDMQLQGIGVHVMYAYGGPARAPTLATRRVLALTPRSLHPCSHLARHGDQGLPHGPRLRAVRQGLCRRGERVHQHADRVGGSYPASRTLDHRPHLPRIRLVCQPGFGLGVHRCGTSRSRRRLVSAART